MKSGHSAEATSWRTFVQALVNTAFAGLVTNFLWFALVFWVYLETRSILATGILGGGYMILLSLSSMWFGSLVDRFRKRNVMLASAWITLVAFSLSMLIYLFTPRDLLLDFRQPWFWLFTFVILVGCVVELLRALALATLVTLLVPTDRHANANGLVGAVQGISFILTSVFSGISIGLAGMDVTMVIALVATALPVLHLHFLRIPEQSVHWDKATPAIDLKGGFLAIRVVPGLFALIIFSTFNNLGNGVFMALIDPYGLTLLSPESWGILFGIAGTGYVIGGAIIAKFGLGAKPLRTLLLMVLLMGVVGVILGLRESWWLLLAGIWMFMLLMPSVEAAEQTVIQRVVPYESQGRVFGLAVAIEAAAAPLTSLLIAPVAEFWVVPYMDTAQGQNTWSWLIGEGVAESRGIALIFIFVGIATICLALWAFSTKSYRTLSNTYAGAPKQSPRLEG